MNKCLSCHSSLDIQRLHCPSCEISYDGQFALPRLARLSPQNMELAEIFLLTGGSMKLVGELLATSYPTLRKRIDDMIAELQQLRKQDEIGADELLTAVESGELNVEKASRLGRERSGIA